MTAPDHLAVAAALFDSIESGNVQAVRQIYTEDAVIWHNHDGVEQLVEDNVQSLEWVVRNISELRYDEVRRHATDVGFVQQHVLRGRNGEGTSVAIPCCILGTVRDGRIARIDEYLDSAHVGHLLARKRA